VFGNSGVQVVVKHSNCGFLLPTLGRYGRTGGCVKRVMCVIAHEIHPRLLADYFV